ncbi:hypothetical protein [Agrilutibacter solisilvae]|uniref:DUF5117 domain-containing protein n=1 Tax=Agrilutibacter solisilvae TaxID=2763317 RepID=A0A974XY27_9GAMM|nr:hypothetical protein [Lysobacter solisilvae]QSX77028.1 hypothetical protein I8J32_009415 [Lysobacter solisilvae]
MNHPHVFFALLLGICAACSPAHAGAGPAPRPPEQVNLADLVRDTQMLDAQGQELELVWWIPREYMVAAMAQSADRPGERTERELESLFDEFTLVAVLRGEVSALGAGRFEPEEALRAKVRIQDTEGKVYNPIPADEVDSRMTVLIGILRPVFKQLIGAMGENMQLFVFPGRKGQDQRLADPLGTGRFAVRVGDKEHAFRLPLGSLLMPKQDPATGETFPGSYSFNPYTGGVLSPGAP